MTKTTIPSIFWLLALLFIPHCLWAQKDFALFAQPAIEISVATDSPWEYEFSAHYRNLLYEDEALYESVQIELAHITSYEINAQHSVGLGVKYRFKELFSEGKHDELRFLEQYVYKHSAGALKLQHRLRFEQRFREHLTWRLRYRLSTGIPLSSSDLPLVLKPKAEFLWGMSAYNHPEGEMRVGTSFEKELSTSTALSLGIDYRYEDFLNAPEHALFIMMGIAIAL